MKRMGVVAGLFVVGVSALLAGCGDEIVAGASPLVDAVPEPPGENCKAGGQAIRIGVDRNGDGRLDPDEVTGSSYACNGVSPSTEVASIAPGDARCPHGGTAVRVIGADDAPPEVVVCNGVPGEQGERGEQGAQGAQGDAGPAAPQPVLGTFLTSQIVRGALLTCAGVTHDGARCSGLKLNGTDVYLGSKEANAICAAITGKKFEVMGGAGLTEAPMMRWNGTTWELAVSKGTPMAYLDCQM